MTPHSETDDSAEWRVRLPGDGRVVLVFDKVGMSWTGWWEDTGTPLDSAEIRAAVAIGKVTFEDGREPPKP